MVYNDYQNYNNYKPSEILNILILYYKFISTFFLFWSEIKIIAEFFYSVGSKPDDIFYA